MCVREIGTRGGITAVFAMASVIGAASMARTEVRRTKTEATANSTTPLEGGRYKVKFEVKAGTAYRTSQHVADGSCKGRGPGSRRMRDYGCGLAATGMYIGSGAGDQAGAWARLAW